MLVLISSYKVLLFYLYWGVVWGSLKFGDSLHEASPVKPWKLQGNQCHHPVQSQGDPHWVPGPLVLGCSMALVSKRPLGELSIMSQPPGFYPFPFSLIFCKSHNIMAVIFIYKSHFISLTFITISFTLSFISVTWPSMILTGIYGSLKTIHSLYNLLLH